jgi:NADH:ubiquinone oxidoreductase subunit E
MNGKAFSFSKENLAEAEKIVARYPDGRQQSAVLPLLDIAQKQAGGWLSTDVMNYIADYLGMP